MKHSPVNHSPTSERSGNVTLAPMNGAVLRLRGRLSSRSSQQGMTLMETIAILAIAATVIAFALPRVREAFFNTSLEQAFSELNDVVIVAQQYRQLNRSYTGISVNELRTKGYGLQKFTSDGVGENVYGNTVTVAEDTGNAEITYGFDDDQSCQQIGDRLRQNTYLEVDADPCAESGGIHTLTFQVR